jgi:hypothetical protein
MPRPQKIGVLTFHRCINYGSYWQARRLVEGLRSRGHDAVLLDHDSPRVNRAEWRCALRPLQPAPTPLADHPLYALKARKFFSAFAALPLSRRFDLDQPQGMELYDLVMVGSDEVWNLSHPWYAGYPLFFGDGLRAGRLVSYAASFGSYDASAGLERDWAERLRNFSGLSVRDENSRQLVRRSLDREPELVLDPCLQFPPSKPRVKATSDEVAVYGHSFPDWFARHLRRWAGARGLRLVSIGYRNDWADENWIAAGPEDFARFMARARAVATNFFHGCVFALANATPFICALSGYRFNKIAALATTLGAEDRLVGEQTPSSDFADLLEAPLAPEILLRIEALRVQSQAYLDHVLA